MKKTIITLTIILGMTMTSFADGGLFQRGYKTAASSNADTMPRTASRDTPTSVPLKWAIAPPTPSCPVCPLTARTPTSPPPWVAALPCSSVSAPPILWARSAGRNEIPYGNGKKGVV